MSDGSDLPDDLRKELLRRREAHRRDSSLGATWEQVKAHARARSLQEAEDDIRENRMISHDEMKRRIISWSENPPEK
ncbi:MAG: hypothetical protein ACO1QR_07380 [Chthoniobacteraceae bacterium]